MAYEVLLEKQAEKDLNRLDGRTFGRVVHALQGLKGNPRPVGCRKLEGYEIVGESEWGITGSFMKLPMR
jgi:mRNA-degrading endonuclease RelE of RelBE toxin-antitoxin system